MLNTMMPSGRSTLRTYSHACVAAHAARTQLDYEGDCTPRTHTTAVPVQGADAVSARSVHGHGAATPRATGVVRNRRV